MEQIREIDKEVKSTYGARRLQAALSRRGQGVSRRHLRQLMTASGVVAKSRRRKRPVTKPTTEAANAANVLNRQFHVDRKNAIWVGDTTYVHTSKGIH